MLNALMGILNFRWLLIGAIVITTVGGGYWYVSNLQDENAALEEANSILRAELFQAIDAAEQNRMEVERVKEESLRQIRSVKKERDRMIKRAKRFQSLLGEIRHAPESDDGPVAPVLGNTLDRLRNEHAKDGSGDSGPD